MYRLLITLLFIAYSSSASAQDTKNYYFSQLNSTSGLTSNTVRAVQQDSIGFIWTLNGNTLQRYDGQRLLTFRHEPNDPNSLPVGVLHTLRIDTKNRLWIIYGSFLVGYFDVITFRFHKVKLNATKEQLHKAGGGVFTGSNGDVILLAMNKFMMTYNEKAREFDEKYNRFQLPKDILPLTFDEGKYDHNYWIGYGNGVVKYNVKQNTLSYPGHNTDNDPYVEAVAGHETVLHFYIDKNKKCWFSGWPETGVYIKCYDPVTKQTTDWDERLGNTMGGMYFSLYGFSELSDGSFWVHGENLLAKLRYDGSRFDPVPNNLPGENRIRFDNVYMMYEDHEKNVWLPTNLGLYRFNPPAQLVMSVKNKRVYDQKDYPHEVTDIFQTREGEIFVATWGEGVFSYDAQFRPSKVDHIYNSAKKMGETLTWAIHQHKNGDLWRAQQGGQLYVWRAATHRTEKIIDPHFENSTIRQISEDKKGNLWFGTQRGYIVKWEYATNKFSLQHKLESIVSRMLIDSSDQLWVCTQANGVIKINTETGAIMRRYVESDTLGVGLRSSGTADVIQYNDTTMIILAEGLNFLNTKTDRFKYFTTENGLPTSSISNIIKDKNGYIWMSSESGLFSYYLPKRKLSIYTYADGVSSNFCNVASSAMLYDGSIVFGTSHDVMIFSPEELTITNYSVPKVEIAGIHLMNKRLNLDSLRKLKTIELGHHQNSLTVELTTLTYQNTYGIYYRMENLEKEWLLTDDSRQVTYNYLPPGDYTLKVACKDENGKMGEISEIWFHIKPPFWKTWWFYSLLVLFIITILMLFDKQRLQRIHKEQEMRSSIAGNLHEEVNTVLQNISVLSEIARIKADTQPEQSKEYIYEIQQKSRNMVVAMNDVLWSINPSNDSMEKTIERIHEVADALQHKHSTSITIQTDKKVNDLYLSMRVRHEFILIYKLSMITLVEVLGAPQTTVQLDYVRGKLHMQIFSLQLQLPKNNNIVTKYLNDIRTRGSHIPGAIIGIQSDEKGTWINFEVNA